MPAEIKPFQISVPDEAIQQVKEKLAAAKFPTDVEFTDDWAYGAPLADVRRVAEYWRDGFDWRAQEAKLNQLPHFTTKVDVDDFGELDMHFVHQRSANPDAIPLLFVHGWPGSFIEVTKIISLLTDASNGQSFHVVAPSLPNYGFSGRVTKRGFSIPQYAESVHKVMLALGYEKYVVQGGDWGFLISRMISLLYPQHCLAVHVNLIMSIQPPTFSQSPFLYLQHALKPYTEAETAGLARTKHFAAEGTGYMQLQSTKPLTLGFALADSPVALLAWIYEKLHDWTDSYPWTDDEVLTWISIYQFSTAGPDASVRIYYENRHVSRPKIAAALGYIPVPLGVSVFPRDLSHVPRIWREQLGPVVFDVTHDKGGHFAAYECPELLAGDLKTMCSGNGLVKIKARF